MLLTNGEENLVKNSHLDVERRRAADRLSYSSSEGEVPLVVCSDDEGMASCSEAMSSMTSGEKYVGCCVNCMSLWRNGWKSLCLRIL